MNKKITLVKDLSKNQIARINRYGRLDGKSFKHFKVIKLLYVIEGIGCVYECECDCGKHFEGRAVAIRHGTLSSCGCHHGDILAQFSTTHGLSRHPLYRTWCNMKERVERPKNLYTKLHYGNRGITICEEWKHDFKAFYDWAIANGWSDERLDSGRHKLTIDRIDNNKGYSPENCRWVDMKVQSNNRSKKLFNNGVGKLLVGVKYHYGCKNNGKHTKQRFENYNKN